MRGENNSLYEREIFEIFNLRRWLQVSLQRQIELCQVWRQETLYIHNAVIRQT